MKTKFILLIIVIFSLLLSTACFKPKGESKPQSETTSAVESAPQSESNLESESETESEPIALDQRFTVENGIITAYLGNDKILDIPTSINGQTVTAIGEKAFYNTVIEEITIPSSVLEIDGFAFANCKNLKKVTFSNGLETIGEGAFYNCVKIPSLDLPDSLKSIGLGAFAIDLQLTDLEDGKKAITSVENELTKISLPFIGATPSLSATSYFAYIFGANRVTDNFKSDEGETVTFNGEEVTVNHYNVIPQSLTDVTVKTSGAIADAAFFYCFNLEQITVVDDNLTSIGDYAFEGCENADVYGVENASFIGNRAFLFSGFEGAEFENVYSIGDLAFAYTNLSSFTFPDGIATIGDMAFAYTSLQEVSFPESVESIGDMAFYGCNDLVSARFENPVPCNLGGTLFTVVDGEDVYYSDVKIFVPDFFDGEKYSYELYREDLYLRDYASGIFSEKYERHLGYVVEDGILLGYITMPYEEFTTVKVPVGVDKIADFAFYNCARIITVEMPEGFTTIGKYAFYNCTKVQNLVMPTTLKEIDDYAFTGFFVGNNISRLYFPEGMERIGDGAFMSSFNLKILNIPSTVTYLGYLSFGMGNSLERVYLKPTTPPISGFYDNGIEDVDYNVFSVVNAGKTVIYVPAGVCQSGENQGKTYDEIYKANPTFKDFADFIKPTPEGKEVGHYGNGDLFIDLDGCGGAIISTIQECEVDTSNMGGSKYEFKKEYGSYLLTGAMLTLEFDTFGVINAIYGNRAINFNLDGTVVSLKEPKRYYDAYNWTNFVLYDYENGKGKGTFDMYGSFLTPFEWEISGSEFILSIDGNNKLPEHSDYVGVVDYVGEYNPSSDTFSVAFMLNDYEEIITYTASENKIVYATIKEERLYGKYVCYSDSNSNFAMYTIYSYGNGVLDFYIGENPYPSCSYSIDGDVISFSITILDLTLTIDRHGNLYSDDLFGMEARFVYEDDLLDSTVLPD